MTNIIGQKFGRLTCVKFSHDKEYSRSDRDSNVVHHYYHFKCDCGNEKIISLNSVKRGLTKSCGCLNQENRKKTKDITNQRFGKLIALEPISIGKAGCIEWKCRCDCGNIVNVSISYLNCGDTKSCGCLNQENRKRKCSEHPNWKGYEEISLSYWNNMIKTGLKRGFGTSISIEEAWELFLQQNRKCALTGLPLTFANEYGSNNSRYRTASLDRIDSSKGYDKENVQWVHKRVNKMKWDLDQKEFIQLCKLISENN